MSATGKLRIVYSAGVWPGLRVGQRVSVAGEVERQQTVLLGCPDAERLAVELLRLLNALVFANTVGSLSFVRKWCIGSDA
jgi:hypothetical protein